jgi:hypothetical protein
MPDLDRLLPGLLIAAMAVVLLWFTFGTQANIRNGNRVLAWLQDGLGILGRRATLRWLGSSVAELKIVEPAAPFREAIVMVVLEPRDLGALWALSRSRGRRDFLLLRLSLSRSPLIAGDLVDPAAWTAGHLADRSEEPLPERPWTDGSGTSLRLHQEPGAGAGLEDAWERLRTVSGGLWRVSVRPTVPHLEIHIPLPSIEGTSSRRLLGEVRDIASGLISAG